MWRIVYLITELDIGGAENSLYQLLTRLDKEKYSPTVVSLTHRGRVGERLEEKKIPVICLNMRSKRDLSVFFKLAELLRERKPHILHTYLFHANFIGRIVGRYLRVPIIISSVRVMEKERPYHLYLNMLSYWMVDKQVCVSKKVEKFIRRKAKVPLSKLTTIYNGVDLSCFSPLSNQEREKMMEELSISRFDHTIGTIARLTTQKGLSYLLKAFQLLRKDFPNSCLLIVGKGSQEERLKRLSETLGISSCVKFLGFREDAWKILDLMDVFVLPSLWEGMPNVILEAQALGKPVVATWVGGSREIIIDGENGFLVPPYDWWSLAQSVRRLLDSPSLREKFGEKGKKLMNEKFTIGKMVETTENLYQELIEKKILSLRQ